MPMGKTNPIMNFIFPLRAVSAVIGTSWGSRGPKIPCGLTAVVNSESSLASNTSCNSNTKM